MPPPFLNRRHAGQILGDELSRRKDPVAPDGNPPLVLALPRGGVPVGFEVASRLRAPLDVFVVRKLGVPGHPELAMGALASGGKRVLNEPVIRRLGITPIVIEEVSRVEMRELLRRESHYRGDLAPVSLEEQHVILVDDGLATGATMRAAIEAVRTHEPSSVTVAVPVAPFETARRLAEAADEFVSVVEADNFVAVGQWYEDFSQTSDEDVRTLLMQSRASNGDRVVL